MNHTPRAIIKREMLPENAQDILQPIVTCRNVLFILKGKLESNEMIVYTNAKQRFSSCDVVTARTF